MIQGVILFFAFLYVMVNLLVDLSYLFLDRGFATDALEPKDEGTIDQWRLSATPLMRWTGRSAAIGANANLCKDGA